MGGCHGIDGRLMAAGAGKLSRFSRTRLRQPFLKLLSLQRTRCFFRLAEHAQVIHLLDEFVDASNRKSRIAIRFVCRSASQGSGGRPPDVRPERASKYENPRIRKTTR
ncbi:hypothetical protein PUN4_920020 [Paraburkholderia unamae]|nr:hypothetical protein PUN4_920020 [Paraburkholderia unamae]